MIENEEDPPRVGAAPGSPVLVTQRLRLRPLLAADADHLAALDAAPEVRRYVHLGDAPTRDDLAAALPRLLARFGSPPVEPAFWAAEARGSGAFLGWFHLRPAAEPGTVELGYRLRRDCWGRGYATEGSAALLQRAFGHLGAGRVEASALAANLASIRVMEKVGMQLIDTFRHEGRPAVLYAVDRDSAPMAPEPGVQEHGMASGATSPPNHPNRPC